MKPYEHKSIEDKWQARWDEARVFATPEIAEGEKGSFILDMFPYPSGSGLHVGHLLGYTGSDIVSRITRMQGKKVLHPMGWDSFGLPAENYALKTGVHPEDSTAVNTKEYKRQFRQAGIGYDWDKELMTSDPSFYKWTQWLFLFLYEQGLAYRKEGAVNWCPKDQTVLANEQVVNGMCDRCGSQVVQKNLKQWYFKITEFAEDLLAELDNLDWPEKIKAMQRNWIGKSEGAQLFFMTESGETVEVFTTRPDTLFGATYLVLAPEHPLVESLTTNAQKEYVDAYRAEVAKKSELERLHLDKDKTGVWTGSFAEHPLTGEKLPIWIADYVLLTYGTGAIMAVPAHDERDHQFATKFDLPIIQVIEPVTGTVLLDEEFRRSIVAILEDPHTGKVLSINWGSSMGGNLFIGGGIEGEEDLIEAARREITEETGYTTFDFVSQTETIHHHYRAHSKNVNRYIQAVGLHFKLQTQEQTPVKLDEAEQGKFTTEWLSASEAESKVQDPLHALVFKRLIKQEVYTGYGILTSSGEFTGQSSEEAKLSIIESLASTGVKLTTTYRLRDWLVSRQRFWGAPIPVAYDDEGNEFLIPEDQLPVVLPRDVEFSPTGQSPLVNATEWRKVTLDGKELLREADTLDTFVCSSWYFLRFPNPHYSEGPFDPDMIKKWLPVDVYMGGAEHAVLHLLYARFITKALHRAGLIDFTEPFTSLRNQGSILGPDHQKMSKSKGNVINPDEVVSDLGADTLRTYEMFMAPFEVEKPWSTTGIIGVRRFLEKVWRLQERIQEREPSTGELAVINKAIKKITEDVAECKFNTCVSTLMETVNAFSEQEHIAKTVYSEFITILSPFAPHIAEEIWESLGNSGFACQAHWPTWNEKFLTTDTWTCAVQINGKVRAKLELPTDLSEEGIRAAVESDATVQSHIAGKTIQKVVVVPGRLVSLVVS